MTGGTELYSLSTLHAPEILFLLVVHSIEIQAQLILFSDIQTIYAAKSSYHNLSICFIFNNNS